MLFMNNMEFIVDKLVIMTELLLYLSFSLLVGGLLTNIVPKDKQPVIQIPRKLLLLCTVMIPILAFAPLIETHIFLSENLGFWTAFLSILFTFEVGKAWLVTFAVSVVLFILLNKKDGKDHPSIAKAALFFILLLVMALGYAGHASTITQGSGFIAHSFHFLAVIVWVGLLLAVAWFSKNQSNWLAFLKWFTPVAIICVVVLSVAGFFTMEIDIQNYDNWNDSIVKEYKNSWMVNYGQALLIKHLLIIPLLTFAFLNGFIMKAKIKKEPTYNPITLVRVESVFVVFVFAATALMGQGYPPHQVSLLLEAGGASPLFNAIYQGEVTPSMNVILGFGSTSYLLFASSFVFLALMVVSALKKTPAIVYTLFGLLFVISFYLGLMLGVK